MGSDKPRFQWRDVPGTTIALTSLAVLGAAAVISTPLWLWYRRKRKKADALARQGDPNMPGSAAALEQFERDAAEPDAAQAPADAADDTNSGRK
jgi:hypothetical protein